VNAGILAYPWVRRTPYSGEEREGRLVRGNLEVKRHRFTAREFRAMAEAGVLGEDDRVELVDGEIVDMAPIGSRHLSCVVALTHLLVEWAQGRYFVSVQNPVRLSERDEPQPDLTFLKRRTDPAAPCLPDPEVSDTTLSYDRNVKLPLYARAGIPEAWVIDLNAGNAEVHSQPAPEAYGESRSFGSGNYVASGIAEGLSVPVDEMLG
jgi:Uma2 family endonuclease